MFQKESEEILMLTSGHISCICAPCSHSKILQDYLRRAYAGGQADAAAGAARVAAEAARAAARVARVARAAAEDCARAAAQAA